ncbi:hypothetical protein [Maribacter sp. HTCC2170]|uniref:hypothetical protein n=1 Tax=Maribacter sp. (strain HTCC2170 / KCCM 42371) TaxID=313603 RepID=UPI00006BD319|nr:hypothetical protein [Maribacter sp. HTCC2170]EAR02905.1 hypothetical protein FB2170_06440 [Maribacter sp. HTCC2170]
MAGKIVHTVVLTLAIFITTQICFGQNSENVGEKYKNAYKKYLSANCPIPEDSIQHFVYFARERHEIIDHPLLRHPMFKGAQIMYFWKNFEPSKGQYDFSLLKEDYDYLKKHGKKLFLQIQDATFYPNNNAVPDYLLTDDYDGGAIQQYTENGEPAGWVAKRWNEKVRERFALFLQALGEEYDGKIEGINLQETAIEVSEKMDSTFSEQKYVAGLKANMKALKRAFSNSTTMIYANFMPGEWLPWEDKGYLKSIYKYGEEIGVGLGGPDLMVKRTGQLNHTITLMHEGKYTVPLGIAIQDGNYIGETGEVEHANVDEHNENIVPLLHGFAKDFLKVRYMFWVNQEPYFKEHVIPCFSKK